MSLRPEWQPVGRFGDRLLGRGAPRRRSSRAGRDRCLDPTFSLVHFWQALALAEVGRFDEAMTEALASRTASATCPSRPSATSTAAPAVLPKPSRCCGRSRRHAPIHLRPGHDLALVAVGMGDREAALTWLERGYDEHARWWVARASVPLFDPLRDEPRFKAIVAKMKFP